MGIVSRLRRHVGLVPNPITVDQLITDALLP